MAAPEIDIVMIERSELDTAQDLDLCLAVYSQIAEEDYNEDDGVQMCAGGGAEGGG